MKGLRRRFERFCYKNRNWGIPNLMLYVVLGSGIVYILQMLGYDQIYSLLCFDRDMILKGQVWRLISYVFTTGSSGIFFTLILLYCYYSLGNALEHTWGTLRFNLYYLTGILLMDVFAMVCGGIEIFDAENMVYMNSEILNYYYSGNMAYYLNLSLLICYATVYTESQFVIFFVIPIRAWILALIYLIIMVVEVINWTVPVSLFPHNLFPLIALANYFLFFGKDVINVLPPFMRRWFTPKRNQPKKVGKIPLGGKQKSAAYSHRCAVCGKTDVSNPELEFRYCSRCNGYFCYCQEHINNHTHVE